jgi:hypothetical protein
MRRWSLWGKAQRERAGIRLFGLNAALLAPLAIISDGFGDSMPGQRSRPALGSP